MRFLSFFLAIFCIHLPGSYEITVLATNISNYGGFGEWSFSALYESEDESVLFDTGFHEDTVLHNAKVLGKDLSKVEKVILSHFHSDHTGGLIKLRDTFKDINSKAFTKVYVARGFFNQRYTSDGTMEGPGNYSEARRWKLDAEKLGINNNLVLTTLEEVLDNIYLCKGKNIKTLFNMVYYLTFRLCMEKVDVSGLDLVQGDGADTLLGSLQVFMYKDTPHYMKKYNVDYREVNDEGIM